MTKVNRVLVTGGAGFIGSELVRQLAERAKQVIIIDNLSAGKRENLEGVLGDRVQLITADMRDEKRLPDLMQGVDVIFHLACLGVRHSIHSPQENHTVNATATLQLLLAARKVGVKRFVHVSSSEIYGTACHVPMAEDHPISPMTVYGASKLAGECYARSFFKTYGYPTVVIRPFNAYGPRCHHEGDSGEVIPKFLLRCMAGLPMIIFGDGSQTRDFSDVSDIASGILMAGLAKETIGETINLGSGREISIKQLAGEAAKAAGQPKPMIRHDAPRPGDVSRLCADTTKARRLFGFKPKISLGEGLVRLRDWYLSVGNSPQTLLKEERVRNWELKAPPKKHQASKVSSL